MEKYFSIIIGVLIILDFLWCHLVENDLERLLRSDTLFIFLVIYTLLILCCLFNTGFVEIFSYVECVGKDGHSSRRLSEIDLFNIISFGSNLGYFVYNCLTYKRQPFLDKIFSDPQIVDDSSKEQMELLLQIKEKLDSLQKQLALTNQRVNQIEINTQSAKIGFDFLPLFMNHMIIPAGISVYLIYKTNRYLYHNHTKFYNMEKGKFFRLAQEMHTFNRRPTLIKDRALMNLLLNYKLNPIGFTLGSFFLLSASFSIISPEILQTCIQIKQNL